MPVFGTSAATTAMFTHGCREGDADALERDDEEQHDHRQRPEQAELVAEHGEDRIRVRRRQEAELLLPRPEPFAQRTTEGEPVDGLDRLEARALRVAPWVHERGEARHPVWLDDRDRRGADRREAAERRELAEARAGDEVHREADRGDDDRGAEIGLSDDERGDEGEGRHERHGHRPPADELALRREPEREVDDERQLRELRGLQARERREAQPA